MKIALGIEYRGTAYHGWQKQQNKLTVQSSLERVLGEIAAHPVKLYCAGRTDCGVHALAQVVHFELNHDRNLAAWLRGANVKLPSDIAVRWAQPVADDFHARFSARWRYYRYYIYNSPQRSAFFAPYSWWVPQPLNLAAMQEAAQSLLGEHDFSSFRSTDCQSLSPRRNLQELSLTQLPNHLIAIDVRANAFLYNMVRNLLGVLLKIGLGSQPASWSAEVLAAKDRRKASNTAPAQGLSLVGVGYPEQYQLPNPQYGHFGDKLWAPAG